MSESLDPNSEEYASGGKDTAPDIQPEDGDEKTVEGNEGTNGTPISNKQDKACEASDTPPSTACDSNDDALVVYEEHCPVCLTEDVELVRGPCQHTFCKPCMERVLNAEGNLAPPQSAVDSHLSAPTLGRCPICRCELSLFDVVHAETEEILHPPNPLYHEDYGDPLKDAVYIPYRGKVGQLSFHWDWSKIQNRDHSMPFLNMSRPIKSNPHKWRMANGQLPNRVQYFEPGCHFHKHSRTFHGTIRWPHRLNGSHQWDVVLGFPKDFRFLSSGRIHIRREYLVKEEELPEDMTAEQRQLCRFPLDGRWTISWRGASGELKTSQIQVRNNEYVQGGWSFYLHFDDDPNHPHVRWPKSTHVQTLQEGLNLAEEPLGPKVGSKIRWTTTSPAFPELVWERQTIGPLPLPKVILFGMGQGKVLYQRLDTKSSLHDVIPNYHGDSVWGNVFCKRLYIGSASYHLLSPDNCYISYEHPACRDLPPLDDGSPMPTRVNFRNVVWDDEERKLTASIEWESDFGTSWNDNVRWSLTMYFDTEYMVILKGGIQCEWCQERRSRPRPPRAVNPNRPPPVAVYVPPPQPEPTPGEPSPPPERNEEWIMSGYGHDQIYINAAMLERYRDESVVVDWDGLAEQHATRLQVEGATKRSVDFVEHVFSLAAANPNSNPIDFLSIAS